MNRICGVTLRAGLLCLFCLLATNLLAQGCASCYTTAAAGGSQTAHALRSGILLLVLPPTIFFAAIIVGVRRWRNADQVGHGLRDLNLGVDSSAQDGQRIS